MAVAARKISDHGSTDRSHTGTNGTRTRRNRRTERWRCHAHAHPGAATGEIAEGKVVFGRLCFAIGLNRDLDASCDGFQFLGDSSRHFIKGRGVRGLFFPGRTVLGGDAQRVGWGFGIADFLRSFGDADESLQHTIYQQPPHFPSLCHGHLLHHLLPFKLHVSLDQGVAHDTTTAGIRRLCQLVGRRLAVCLGEASQTAPCVKRPSA